MGKYLLDWELEGLIMKKLFITLMLLLFTVIAYADLVIVEPWKLPPSRPLPYHYDMLVELDGTNYAVKNLDGRRFNTRPKALQEAKYRLKMEERPFVGGANGYTLEQELALLSFNSAFNHYNNARNLVEMGVLTITEAKIAGHKIRVRQWYNACIALSVDVWSP